MMDCCNTLRASPQRCSPFPPFSTAPSFFVITLGRDAVLGVMCRLLCVSPPGALLTMLAAATMAASAADGEAALLPRVCSTSSTLWRPARCSTPGRTAARHAAPSTMLWLQTSLELPA